MAGLIPDDGVIVRLDRGSVDVPSCLGPLPPLPNPQPLLSSLEMFRANSASDREGRFSESADSAEAYQADLAFPHREQASAHRLHAGYMAAA